MSEQRPTILLIFDWCGEKDTAIYVIPDAPDWVTRCHQRYGGGTDEDTDILRLMDAIEDNLVYLNDPDEPLAGEWVKHRVNLSTPRMPIKADAIVVTGWVP